MNIDDLFTEMIMTVGNSAIDVEIRKAKQCGMINPDFTMSSGSRKLLIKSIGGYIGAQQIVLNVDKLRYEDAIALITRACEGPLRTLILGFLRGYEYGMKETDRK